jgi:hypothetical protein
MPVAEASIAELFMAEFSSVFNTSSASIVSTSFYQRLRDVTVPRLLARFQTGTVKLIKKTVSATDDPLEPETTSFTEYSRQAVVTGFPTQFTDPAGAPRNDYIRDSDLMVIFGANSLSVVPVAADQVMIDDITYTVEDVKQIPAAGIAVLYKLQVRK